MKISKVGPGEAQKERVVLREIIVFQFQECQAQLNRNHELQLMQLMVNLQNKPVPQSSFQTTMPTRMPMVYSQPIYPNPNPSLYTVEGDVQSIMEL